MTAQPRFQEFQVKTPPVAPATANAIYWVKADGADAVQAYVTDKDGTPFPHTADEAAKLAAEAARDAAIQSASYAETQKIAAEVAANRAATAFSNVVNAGGETSGYTQLLDDISGSFNGSTATFNLTLGSVPVAPFAAVHLLVTVGGVVQTPGDDYSISGSQITFVVAPAATLSCEVVHLKASVMSDADEVNAALGYTAADAAALATMGTLVDDFRQSGDPDDTLSLSRAITAGVPVRFGPRTYTINNFVQPAASRVILIGVSGATVIQRTSASGGDFFKLTAAAVAVHGIIFDMNSAAVTANQWGVRVVTDTGNVSTSIFDRCVFKYNSGTLGSGLVYYGSGPILTHRHVVRHCEITATSWQGLYVGSTANVEIDRCWVHDNSGGAIFATAVGTPSSVNYATEVRVSRCRIERNAGSVGFGGHGAPYNTTTLVACTNSGITDSTLVDNTGSAIAMMGDNIQAIDCIVTLSSGVSAYNALLGYGRFLEVRGCTIDYSRAATLTDGVCEFGGCIEIEVVDNKIIAPMGAAINIGGSLESLVQDNSITISGTAAAVVVNKREGDGAGHGFPNAVDNLVIKGNTITWKTGGGACEGIRLTNGAGSKTGGAAGITIEDNDFNDAPGVGVYSQNRIVSYGGGYTCRNNRVNGGSRMYGDPDAAGLLVLYEPYDEIYGLGSTNPIKKIHPFWYNTNQGVVTSVAVTGGTGYNPATTTVVFTTTGNTGTIPTAHCIFNADGTPDFVNVDNPGTFCATVTAALVDSSGSGSGAVLTVTTGSPGPVMKALRFKQTVSIVAGTTLGQFAVYTPTTSYRLRPFQIVDMLFDFYWQTDLPLPFRRATRVVTAAGDVTVTTADDVVIVNKTTGAATVANLPASPSLNDVYTIKDGKGDAATNPITLTPASGNIDGAATAVIDKAYGCLDAIWNGTEWSILG